MEVSQHVCLCAAANVGALASSVDPCQCQIPIGFSLLLNARALGCTLAWRLGACHELLIEEVKAADELDLQQRCGATKKYVLPGVGTHFRTAA